MVGSGGLATFRPRTTASYEAPRTAGGAGLQQTSDGYSYTLPGTAAASQGLRDLQTQSVGGLSDLMSADYDASRQQFQDAMYAGQEEAITRAMERERGVMAEGQFARGIGQSSSTENLLTDMNREYFDSLGRANRESYLAAGGENRADLAARSGLYGLGFNAGTTGLQAEANIGQANANRLQQGQQFNAGLASSERQAEANRAMQSEQFQQGLQLNYAQLAEQAKQFGATLDFNTQQALMNRAQQMTLTQMGLDFNYAQLNQQGEQFGQQMGFNQQQLAQQNAQFGQTLGFNQQQLGQQGEQFGQQMAFNNANLAQQGGLATSAQNLQQQIAANNLALQYAQLQQQNNQFNQGLGANQGNQTSNALAAGLTGLAGLFAPTMGAAGTAANSWLSSLLGLTPAQINDPEIMGVLRQLGLA